jgi:preprotein translocase subunit SecE
MIDRITNYLKGVRAEVARVSWPTRNEVISLTVLILVMTIIVTIYLWGVDGILATILGFLVRNG